MLTDRQAEVIKLVQQGESMRGIARKLGINIKTVYDVRRRAEKHVDPAIQAGMSALGMEVVPSGGWIKSTTPDENGRTYSFIIPRDEPSQDDFAERIRAALEGLEPAVPVVPPETVASDLCNVFPLFDVHFGLHAWGTETRGQDYDLKHAVSDLKLAFESVLQITPLAEEAVLLIGGDFFHADDSRNETPANRHKLDVDGRYNKVVDEAIEVMGYVIDRLAARHNGVTICVIRGNHDEHSHVALRVGLGQRYRLDARIKVETSLDGLFMRQWGWSAIFAHHGDKASLERQALYLADVCPFWSETRHRHYYTGHVHKDQSRDLGPVKWESLRAFCPPDSYAASMGYASRRALKADTYHRQKGRVASAFDPIERAA